MSDPFAPSEGVPAALTAGTSWSLRFCGLADDLSGLSFAVAFAPAEGGAAVEFPGAAQADGSVIFAAAPAATASLAPGPHAWAVWITRDADGAKAAGPAGTSRIAPAPVAGGETAADGRTAARRMLDAIEAVLEGRIPADVENYAIEGRSLTRTPLSELMQHRDRLRREVARENGRGRLRFHPVNLR